MNMELQAELEVRRRPDAIDGNLRICLLADASTPHSVKWANHFALQGHEVHILSFESGRGLSKDVQLHHLQPQVHPNVRYFLAARLARQLVAEIQPDILHAHYASGYGTLGRLMRFHPYILSAWGTDVFEFPETSVLHRALLKANLESADHVCATSHIMARHLRRYCRKAITVTPFGVDCSRFLPRNGHVSDQAGFVIGTVKTLEPRYGIEYLIRAFALCANRFPEVKMRLVIVGDGSLRGLLQQLARDLAIGGITDFVGPVPHERIPEVLSGFTVFAALSLAESFGVAVLEASACGLPVVVSNVGGLPEVVVAESTGMVVPPRDPDAAAEAFSALMRDTELRHRLGKAGREHVLVNYEWSENAGRMMALYASLLQQPSERGL